MITLPFPAKILWPNGRGHHMAKHREFQKHKGWAYHAALSALPRGFKHNGEPITMRVTITPKTAHKIDADNAVASLKAYFDGIAQALQVDDSCFTVPTIEFAKARKPGGVEVVFAVKRSDAKLLGEYPAAPASDRIDSSPSSTEADR